MSRILRETLAIERVLDEILCHSEEAGPWQEVVMVHPRTRFANSPTEGLSTHTLEVSLTYCMAPRTRRTKVYLHAKLRVKATVEEDRHGSIRLEIETQGSDKVPFIFGRCVNFTGMRSWSFHRLPGGRVTRNRVRVVGS